MNKSRLLVLLFLVLVGVSNTAVHGQAGLCPGFYSKSCPQAESIVRSTLQSIVRSNPIIAARLLRMFFHDCFVRGCDASVLIDGAGTERQAPPNVNLVGGYEAVDQIKANLEAACPGVVSCADIIALAARDSVVLSGGLSWQVPTGRRDGRVSVGSETSALVGPNESIASQKQKFANQGLNTEDLVILVGGHTIGQTACQFFSDRLNGSTADPSIDPSFVPFLRQLCPQNQGTKRVALDTGSQFKFDTSYYANLQRGHGILRSDQLLWTDASTRGFVQKYSAAGPFNLAFANSMVKMGNIGIKTGSNGEIRKKCSAIN